MKINRLFALVFLSIVAHLTLVLPANAQKKGAANCYIGFEYQLSYNENWGANRPVILSVEPLSPADRAGLNVGDIIDSINGEPTANMDETALIAKLTDPNNDETRLSVSNFAYHHSNRILPRYCLDYNMIDERQLTRAFSLYSMEDASERVIVYPFDTGKEGQTSFEAYQSFAFVNAKSTASDETDEAIKAALKQSLERKGLRYDAGDADVVVDFYYRLANNPFYKPELAKRTPTRNCLRIAPESGILTPLPFLEVGADKQLAPYVLTFGIRFFDARNSGRMLWSCEAVEHFLHEYTIADYAHNAVPVMLMQFPFVRYELNPSIRAVSRRYNYTGIVYNADDISLVALVVPGSPADKAGIKAGDRISAINGKLLDTKEALNKAYHSFIKETLRYRDESTLFTERSGLKNCRFWGADYYKKLAKQFAKPKYKTAFAYLFNFRPYINGESPRPFITFDIVSSDGVIRQIDVTPELKVASYYSLE